MSDKRIRKRIKRFIRYCFLRFLFASIGLVPFELAKRFAISASKIVFRLARRERSKALASLAIAFPDKTDAEREAIARATFGHLAICAVELCSLHKIDPIIASYVQFPEADRNLLKEAIAEGNGVVFVSGHVGNFELLARRIAMDGFPSQTIAKETSDPRLTRLIEKTRASGKLRSIWRGRDGAAREMLRALKKGEMLGLLIDQDTKVQGVFVDFFGKKAFTPRAAADLAIRTKAAVVTGFIFRRDNGGHRIVLARKQLPSTADREEGALMLTQELTIEIERAIRLVPHAWVWMHQRWKTEESKVGKQFTAS